jgi:hypothetical protein
VAPEKLPPGRVLILVLAAAVAASTWFLFSLRCLIEPLPPPGSL